MQCSSGFLNDDNGWQGTGNDIGLEAEQCQVNWTVLLVDPNAFQCVLRDQVHTKPFYLLFFVATFEDIDNDEGSLQNQEDCSRNGPDLPCL